jgi:hypothetical protein
MSSDESATRDGQPDSGQMRGDQMLGRRRRGQLDNGWHVKVATPVVAYVLLVIVALELGFTVPAIIPSWVLAVPPAVVIFWWVPIVAYILISAVWSRL